MDFMFEDEADEVGSDVEAYCPKCKADTTHVVISKYEEEIRRVQCNPCGDVHSFRKPRGEVEEDVPEPVAARKRAAMKKPTWEEFFAKHSDKNAKPYEFRELYRENVIVTHPKFGSGFVSEVVSDSKVEITFKDARRILVHNRKDIPGLPLAAEGDGMPTPPKGSTIGKDKDSKDSKEPKDSRDRDPKDKPGKEQPVKAVGKAKPSAPVAPPPAPPPPPAPVTAKPAKAERMEKPEPRPKAPEKAERGEKLEKQTAKTAAKPSREKDAKSESRSDAKAAKDKKAKAAVAKAPVKKAAKKR